MIDEPPPDRRELGYYIALSQVGLEMVVPLIVGAFVDSCFGTGPWLTVAGAVVGFVGGMMHLVALANKQNARRSDHSKVKDRDP
jgi:F0F1-type ATP synthase assembly protein I